MQSGYISVIPIQNICQDSRPSHIIYIIFKKDFKGEGNYPQQYKGPMNPLENRPMAQKEIETVKEAEKKAKEIVLNAQKKADSIVTNAKAKADMSKKQELSKFEDVLKLRRKAAEEEALAEAENIKEQGRKDAEVIKREGSLRLGEAVEHIVTRISQA